MASLHKIQLFCSILYDLKKKRLTSHDRLQQRIQRRFTYTKYNQEVVISRFCNDLFYNSNTMTFSTQIFTAPWQCIGKADPCRFFPHSTFGDNPCIEPRVAAIAEHKERPALQILVELACDHAREPIKYFAHIPGPQCHEHAQGSRETQHTPLRMARSTKSTKRCGAQTILICDEITYNPPPI